MRNKKNAPCCHTPEKYVFLYRQNGRREQPIPNILSAKPPVRQCRYSRWRKTGQSNSRDFEVRRKTQIWIVQCGKCSSLGGRSRLLARTYQTHATKVHTFFELRSVNLSCEIVAICYGTSKLSSNQRILALQGLARRLHFFHQIEANYHRNHEASNF